jgi:hypothetical protein
MLACFKANNSNKKNYIIDKLRIMVRIHTNPQISAHTANIKTISCNDNELGSNPNALTHGSLVLE